jgi:orotidine-5'-phosphate decarboxylase
VTGRERIFVALDTPDADGARKLVRALAGRVGGFKVGLELFTACGPDLVRELADAGAPVFLDLKLHDIPNTVAGATASAARLGARFLTVHALGGEEMIRRAVASAADVAAARGDAPLTILAVTVLTSHDDAGLDRIGVRGTCTEAVVRLAGLARDAGAGGVVCSPLEVAQVRRAFPGGTLVVPGIRPAAASVGSDDQQRTATPASTVASGADRIVVGRPITRAADPAAAAAGIAREIDERGGG